MHVKNKEIMLSNGGFWKVYINLIKIYYGSVTLTKSTYTICNLIMTLYLLSIDPII